MAKFSKDYQPANRGRKKRNWNAKSFDHDTVEKALTVLKTALDNGENWAVMAVIDRVFPKMKPILPKGSLEAEELRLKVEQSTDISELITTCEKFIELNKDKMGEIQ